MIYITAAHMSAGVSVGGKALDISAGQEVVAYGISLL
jgi:hypothetical protein